MAHCPRPPLPACLPLALPAPCRRAVGGRRRAVHFPCAGLLRLLARRLLSQSHGHCSQVCRSGHVSVCARSRPVAALSCLSRCCCRCYPALGAPGWLSGWLSQLTCTPSASLPACPSLARTPQGHQQHGGHAGGGGGRVGHRLPAAVGRRGRSRRGVVPGLCRRGAADAGGQPGVPGGGTRGAAVWRRRIRFPVT